MNITEDETLALKTYVKLMRATESLTTRLHRHLSVYALTVSQFGIIEALHHLGPLTQKEISRKILRSGGNVTLAIDKLEARRLVRREKHPKDRRSFIVHLTTEGKELIKTVFPRHTTLVMDAMSVLSTAEQQELGRLCKKVGLHQ